MLSHSKKTNCEMKMKEKTTENVNQEKKGRLYWMIMFCTN